MVIDTGVQESLIKERASGSETDVVLRVICLRCTVDMSNTDDYIIH